MKVVASAWHAHGDQSEFAMGRRQFVVGAFAADRSVDRGNVTGSGLGYRFVCPELRESVHIYVIGDTHIGDDDERDVPYEQYSRRMAAAFSNYVQRGNLASAARKAAARKVDFVVLVGDIVSYPIRKKRNSK